MTWPWWMFWCWKVFYCVWVLWVLSCCVLCSTQLATQKFAIVLCPHSSASSFRRFSSSKWWCETSHSAFWVLFVPFELHSSLLNGKSEWLTVHNGMFPALWTKPTRRRPRKIKTSFLITQQIQIDIPILDTLLACGRTWLGNWYLLLFVCISNKKTVFKASKLFWHIHPSCDIIETAQWIPSLTLKLGEEWSSPRNQTNKFIWYIIFD